MFSVNNFLFQKTKSKLTIAFQEQPLNWTGKVKCVFVVSWKPGRRFGMKLVPLQCEGPRSYSAGGLLDYQAHICSHLCRCGSDPLCVRGCDGRRSEGRVCSGGAGGAPNRPTRQAGAPCILLPQCPRFGPIWRTLLLRFMMSSLL